MNVNVIVRIFLSCLWGLWLVQYEQETGLPFNLAAWLEYKQLQPDSTRPDGPIVPPCCPPERSSGEGRLHEGERSTSVLHIGPLAASHGQDSHTSVRVDHIRVADCHSQTVDQVPERYVERSPLAVHNKSYPACSPRAAESPGRSVQSSSISGSNGCICQPPRLTQVVSRTDEVQAVHLKGDLGAWSAWRKKRKKTSAPVPSGHIVRFTAEIVLSPEKPGLSGDRRSSRGLSIESPSKLCALGWSAWRAKQNTLDDLEWLYP